MGSRIALLASVVFSGVALTATSLSAAPAAATSAAEECITKPKGVAPAGQHWYFNTNRALHRKCWYLADADQKVVATAQQKRPAPKVAADPAPEAREPREATNARAEFVDTPQAEQPSAFIAPAPTAAVQPAAPQPEPSQVQPQVANGRDWTVAGRWPEAADAFTAASGSASAGSGSAIAGSGSASAGNTSAFPDPATSPQRDQPSLLMAATPVQEASAVADDNANADANGSAGFNVQNLNVGELDFGAIGAVALFFLVVVGTIVVFNRRHAPAVVPEPDREWNDDSQPLEMPWTRRAVASAAWAERQHEKGQDDRIDEIERLLERERSVIRIAR